jgi:hypothetical protein
MNHLIVIVVAGTQLPPILEVIVLLRSKFEEFDSARVE